jgi:hypothetical protein
MKTLLSVLALALVIGCAPSTVRTVTLKNPFDKDQADRLLRTGKNTIKVNAFLRQAGGGVVTCAGETVYLTPATEMAKERITAIYGSVLGGFRRINALPTIKFANADTAYDEKRKSAICSSEGRVTFEKVANGDFYITTRVVWSASNIPQGGNLSKKITVSDGEVLDLVLSNL